MQTPTYVVGIDVAKHTLAIAGSDPRRPVCTLANEERAIEAWLDTLPPQACLGVESTGRYSEPLLQRAAARGLTVYLLNPRDLHHYARSVHRGAKTDPLDARLIARYLQLHYSELRPYRPPSALEQTLQHLQRGRATLVRLSTALNQMLGDLPELATQAQPVQRAMRELQRHLEQRAGQLLAQDPPRADLAKRLCTIPGVGPITSTCFATVLPRLQPTSADALVAYAGHDPVPKDSGNAHGRRRLSKRGPPELRRLAFLAAMAASRNAPEWKALYDALRQRGRPAIQALTILARRMLRTLYALYAHGGTYDPHRLLFQTGQQT